MVVVLRLNRIYTPWRAFAHLNLAIPTELNRPTHLPALTDNNKFMNLMKWSNEIQYAMERILPKFISTSLNQLQSVKFAFVVVVAFASTKTFAKKFTPKLIS